jgi:hypothetical protein
MFVPADMAFWLMAMQPDATGKQAARSSQVVWSFDVQLL